MRATTVSNKALNVGILTAAQADRGEFATDEEVNRFFATYGG